MFKKKIRRPLRIFIKGHKPYIIYKDKKYNIKSTEIKDMLKFINKLHKKTFKKVQTDKKQKKDIKTYINEKIKLTGGPSSTIQPQIQTQNLEKDTFLINKLNEKIEKDKIKINKLDDSIKAIEDKKNNIKAIENDKIDELIVYDKKNKIYNLKTKKIIISGDSIEDVKNKLDEGFNNLVNEQDVLNNEKDKLQSLYDDLQEEKQKLNVESSARKIQTYFKNKVYKNKIKKLEEDKKDIEEQKQNFESLTTLQKKSLLNKENKLIEKEKKLKDLGIDLERKKRYIEYDKVYTNKQLDELSKKLSIPNLDSKVKLSQYYNNFYNISEENKQSKENKLSKENYINLILDVEDKNINNPQIEEIQNEPEQNEEQGDGYYNFGLWNYQIDKIMKPFKLFIKTITLKELDEMIKYIYDNNILIGSFILNVGNHWTAIYFDFKKEYVLEYYDPFGDPPKFNIIKSFKDLILKLNIEVFVKFKINKIQQQDIKTSNCGWFSMYFLIMRFNNYSFKYITKFKDVKRDEKNIEELKNKYDKFGFI